MIKTTFGEVPVGADFYYDNDGARQGRIYKKVNAFTAQRVAENGISDRSPVLNFDLHEVVSVAESAPAQPEPPPEGADQPDTRSNYADGAFHVTISKDRVARLWDGKDAALAGMQDDEAYQPLQLPSVWMRVLDDTARRAANPLLSLEPGDVVVALRDIERIAYGVSIAEGERGVVFAAANAYDDQGGPMVRWFAGGACNVHAGDARKV